MKINFEISDKNKISDIFIILSQASSNLYISCNRAPGAPVSPDCKYQDKKYKSYFTTTSTTTTTTTKTTTTRSTATTALIDDDNYKSLTNTSSLLLQTIDPDKTPVADDTNNNILIAQSHSQPLLYFLSR